MEPLLLIHGYTTNRVLYMATILISGPGFGLLIHGYNTNGALY